MFIGGTDAEAETSIVWPSDAKSWLIWKDPDAGKDGRYEQKGMTEDEMVAWQHWLIGYKFEEAPGVGDGQGSLALYSPWGHKVWATTEQLNWTDLPVYTSMNFKSISLNSNDNVKHSHSHENYICQITFSLSRFLFIHQTFIEHLVWTRAYAPTIGKRMKKTVFILDELRVRVGPGQQTWQRSQHDKTRGSTRGFHSGSTVKNPPANAGDTGLIAGLGRSPGEGKSNPLLYSCLGNPMDRGAWWAIVPGVTEESDTS